MKQQYTHHVNRSLATATRVTAADFLTESPSTMSLAEKPAFDDIEPGSHNWPAIVSEWNFVKDVLLWKETYRHSLSRLVPKFVFHSERMLPCTQEVPDAHRWWCEMVATPLNCVLQNDIKAVMQPLEAVLQPDFGFIDNKRVKLVGEIKSPWHPLAKGLATAPDFMEQESPIRQALAQLYGYMDLNNCRYGVLTTYTYTWFVKRSGDKGELLISPPISYNSKLPSLFECYYFLVCEMEQSGFHYDRSAENSAPGSEATPEGSRPGTPTSAPLSRLTTQTCWSEKSETPGHQRGDVNRADSAQYLDEVSAQEYCWSSLQLDLRLGSGLYGSAWRGSIDGQHAVIKLYDLQKGQEKGWRTEMEVYSLLKDLQGVMIPQVTHCGAIDGMAGFIGMTFCGERCTSVSPEDISQLRETISKLHAKKIAHGDIRLENLTRSEDGRIWLIDFGLAETNADEGLLEEDWDGLGGLTIVD